MNERICSVEGCGRSNVVGRGYCKRCYQRWRHHGHTGFIQVTLTADQRLQYDREYKRRNRPANADERNAKRRQRYANDPLVRSKMAARKKALALRTNNEANRAGGLVRAAIRRGELVRPTICEECGLEKSRIEAAHYDYGQPLRVRWLCVSCHRRWDAADPKTRRPQNPQTPVNKATKAPSAAVTLS